MLKCNTELMKELNALKEEKEKLINFENENSVVEYLQDEKPISTGYDYDKTRADIDKIEAEERRIKQLLALSNATTKVEGYDMTISEALVFLAQLSNKKTQLTGLASRLQLRRSVVYDKVQYHKAMYDVEKVKEEVKELTREISALQMAIDRTNLTNMIDSK